MQQMYSTIEIYKRPKTAAENGPFKRVEETSMSGNRFLEEKIRYTIPRYW